MSKVAISGDSSGTGTFTIKSPNSNSDRTLDLPDAGGTVFVSGQAVTATTGNFSGNVTLGSSVLATPTGSAPAYLCRAWVNFDGTGTPAIRASGNVSSITDNGTGNYTANFTTAMPDSDYSTQICSTAAVTNQGGFNRLSLAGTTPTSVQVLHYEDNALVDTDMLAVAVFR
jgi:hypothetical protein